MNIELLRHLSEAFGPSGCEDEVREIIRNELSQFTKEITVDAVGNLIAHIPGGGPKVLVDAHMDEVGFMVRMIDKNGFVYFIPLGNTMPEIVYAQKVVAKGKRRKLK
ncbi:MAG: M42 family peptidase, partial [bacterium]